MLASLDRFLRSVRSVRVCVIPLPWCTRQFFTQLGEDLGMSEPLTLHHTLLGRPTEIPDDYVTVMALCRADNVQSITRSSSCDRTCSSICGVGIFEYPASAMSPVDRYL